MVVTPIQNFLSSVLARQSSLQARTVTQAPVSANVTTGTSPTSPAVLASGSLLGTSGLHSAAVSLSQLNSLLQVAQGGTQQVNDILVQLQTLAQQAAGGDTGVEDKFQQLLVQIDKIVAGATFGGTKLLDGSLSTPQPESSASSTDALAFPSFSLPDLSTQGLFGNTLPDVSTAASAASALDSLATAQEQASSTNSAINIVQNQAGFIAANVETALANSIAADSVLAPDDLASGSSDTLASLLDDPAISAQTQTAGLPATLLSLLQE